MITNQVQKQDTCSDLVQRAIHGDKDAFGELVKLHEKMVYNLVYHQVGNADDAFDLAQEVFIKAYRAIGSFRGESQFSTWLYRICQNTCKDYRRKKRKHPIVSLSEYGEDTQQNTEMDIPDDSIHSKPDVLYEQKERATLIQQAIMHLSEEHKTIVILRDIQGFSYEDIAEKLEIEIGTVKSRLNRARLHIKEFLIQRNIL